MCCVVFCVCQEKDECNSKTCTGLFLEDICHRPTIFQKNISQLVTIMLFYSINFFLKTFKYFQFQN